MKLDFKNSFSFVPFSAVTGRQKEEAERAPPITNQASQLTATLRKIFQMFADVGIFRAVFLCGEGKSLCG